MAKPMKGRPLTDEVRAEILKHVNQLLSIDGATRVDWFIAIETADGNRLRVSATPDGSHLAKVVR